MHQIHGVLMEMSLKTLYEGEALFGELLGKMDTIGFHLAWAVPGFRNEETGELLQLDGIFLRNQPSG